jgi:chromosome segregation ATPase
MHRPQGGRLLAAVLVAAVTTLSGSAFAADAGGPRIYCWKNAAGKSECGDRAPQDAKVRELNQRGVTVNTQEAAPTPEQLKAREQEAARKKVEAQKAEQQARKDRALLDTFTTEQDIDDKRKREISAVDAHIGNLETTLRNANERQTQAAQKVEDYRKGTGKVPPAIQEEVTRIDQEKLSLNSQLARKRKEITEINTYYSELRARFIELKGPATPASKAPVTPAASATPAPPPAAPTAPAAPAKK